MKTASAGQDCHPAPGPRAVPSRRGGSRGVQRRLRHGASPLEARPERGAGGAWARPTCCDPGCLGVVPALDAGDELAAVLQRVPARQGRLAAAAPGGAEAVGGNGAGQSGLCLPPRRPRPQGQARGAGAARQAGSAGPGPGAAPRGRRQGCARPHVKRPNSAQGTESEFSADSNTVLVHAVACPVSG